MDPTYSGLLTQGAWPPGTTCSSAWGMIFAARSPTVGGPKVSNAPQMSCTGWVSRASSGHEPGRVTSACIIDRGLGPTPWKNHLLGGLTYSGMEISRPGSPGLMRQLNQGLVLRTIRDRGPLSRADIAKATGLSKPSVGEIVEVLLEGEFVHESVADGSGSPRPGPRARLLTFRAKSGHILGIDIGANKMLVMVADLAGEIVGSHRRSTGVRAEIGRDAVLEELRKAVDVTLEDSKVSRSSLMAVGVGTPGIVDPESGRVTIAPQLRGWDGIVLEKSLAPDFPCSVHVANEVHMAVLAERWRGAAQDLDDVVYIQAGVGIGAGILVGGDIYRGAVGGAGEIGSLPLFDNSEGPDRGFGAFEHAAGGSAYARLGRRAIELGGAKGLSDLAGGDLGQVDAKLVFEAARLGDRDALMIVEELAQRLARGVASVVVVLNPRKVVIGGGLSRAGSLLLDPLKRGVDLYVPFAPEIVLSELGDEAVALGAIRFAMRTVEKQLFLPFQTDINAIEAS